MQIGTDTDWASVTAGFDQTLAIKDDGTLWAWGSNGSGQLGDGTRIDRYVPVQIGTDTNWASVVSGAWHTVALKTDHTVWTWGRGGYGQLGDGTLSRMVPAQMGAANDWASVTAGANHAGAVKTDGTLWSWATTARASWAMGPPNAGSDLCRWVPARHGPR